MESRVTFRGEVFELVEDFIDVGYMGENFEAEDLQGQLQKIKRSNEQKAMSLFVSSPFADESLLKLDELLSFIEVPIECYFIFGTVCEKTKVFAKSLKKFQVLKDSFEDFGGLYGVRIESGELEGELAKSLFLISKDGAVFYIEFLKDLEDDFNLERLRVELNRAFITYTGVGCHG